MREKRTDLTGQRFGMLVVVGLHHFNEKSRRAYWECKCDCGQTCVVAGQNMKSGKTRSCGCLRSKRKPSTLCWKCANATDGRKCPWVAFGTPVKGWTADKTVITYQDYTQGTVQQHSYKVHECPLFVPGRW